MGGATSALKARRQKQPQDIAQFRLLGAPSDHYLIPEVPEKRKPTDVNFTIAMAATVAVLLCFLVYTLIYSDINRIIHGYDNCGNVCGSNNPKNYNLDCGEDMTDRPFLSLHTSERDLLPDEEYYYTLGECVSDCGSNAVIMNRCYPRHISTTDSGDNEKQVNIDLGKIVNEIGDDLQKSAGRIVALCFIGLGFCIIMLLLFKYFVAVTVWVILTGSVLGVVVITVFFWWLDSQASSFDVDQNTGPLRVIAITFTIFSLAIVIMLIVLFKRIKLVIRLFKESMKIIFNMPVILLEPLLTFLATLMLVLVFFFLLFLLKTAGNLELIVYGFHDYVPNGAMEFTIWLHAVVCLWFAQFIIGCQHMVIAGAVSAHYFTKDKSMLTSPIYNSFYNLIRYHLGTVAFGSLIITVIALIKALIRGLVNNKHAKILVDCSLRVIEDFLKYLSKNAYIQTAMHGQPFYKSGKRAVRLLYANAISAIAVNSVGDFILFMAKLLIVALTIIVGMAMRDDSIPYFGFGIFIAVVITAILADCLFAVFGIAIDTLFLCYCEDQCMNDGMGRPYYMSVDLMQYMEEAKSQNKDKKQTLIESDTIVI